MGTIRTSDKELREWIPGSMERIIKVTTELQEASYCSEPIKRSIGDLNYVFMA